MPPAAPQRPPIDIIVPFYKNPALVESLFASLHQVAGELSEAGCSVIAVNDSPDDAVLTSALWKAAGRLAPLVPCRVKESPDNLGFVLAVNGAAADSVRSGHDVLVLNSDVVVFPGAIRELARIARADPMIGFVSPRSNDATLCSLPHQPEFRDLRPEDAYATFFELARYLPDWHFVPTAVGFCLYIKNEVLAEIGMFDQAYGRGYNEENDLIMRANRCGYRAALANRAFVYHMGTASFSSSARRSLDDRHAILLHRRYPEYRPQIRQYFGGPRYTAECLLAGLLRDGRGRYRLVMDFSGFGPYHNGTFEAAKEILYRACRQWEPFFDIHVMIAEEARTFHALQTLPVSFVPMDTEQKFAAAFRFGQPFEYDHLLRMNALAVVNVWAMLDPIAWDCLHLADCNVELDLMWRAVFAHADGIVYISEFGRDQFRRRFSLREGLQELVAYPSLDPSEYLPAGRQTGDISEYILVMGNHFAHKRVLPTVAALREAFPREKIVALGIRPGEVKDVVCYTAGRIAEQQIHELYARARCVVFPSLYEGFGIPTLKGLAYRKPVFARAIAVTQEIREKITAAENLILYSSTPDLIARLRKGFPRWQPDSRPSAASENWDSSTEKIGRFLRQNLENVSFATLLARLEHYRLLAGRWGMNEEAGYAGPATIEQSITNLTALVRDRELRIADLQKSLSWRITAPLRKAGAIYLRMAGKLPPDSPS